MRPELLDVRRCPATGGRLHLEVLAAAAGDPVDVGVLVGPAGAYPVVAGIPVLHASGDAVALLRAGRLREATAEAALAAVPRSRVRPLVQACGGLRPLGRAAALVDGALARRQRGADVRRLYPEGADEEPVPPLDELLLRSRTPTRDGHDYFTHRIGTPRHLVALGLLEGAAPPDGPVLDVGCGAGPLTAAAARRHPDRLVVGVDASLPLRLEARRWSAAVEWVCGDARALPFAADTFALVLSSDVLPYVPEQATVVREVARVRRRGGIAVLVTLRHAGHRHVAPGRAHPPAGWDAVTEPLGPRWLLPDDAVLDRYLDRRGPPAGPTRAAQLDASPTLSLVAGAADLDDGPFGGWPHARGPLVLHPLLTPAGAGRHVRRWPSATFARDNARVVDYLPDEVVLPADALRLLGEPGEVVGADPLVARLVRATALLGGPDAAARRGQRSARTSKAEKAVPVSSPHSQLATSPTADTASGPAVGR